MRVEEEGTLPKPSSGSVPRFGTKWIPWAAQQRGLLRRTSPGRDGMCACSSSFPTSSLGYPLAQTHLLFFLAGLCPWRRPLQLLPRVWREHPALWLRGYTAQVWWQSHCWAALWSSGPNWEHSLLRTSPAIWPVVSIPGPLLSCPGPRRLWKRASWGDCGAPEPP